MPRATTQTQCSQLINKLKLFKKRIRRSEETCLGVPSSPRGHLRDHRPRRADELKTQAGAGAGVGSGPLQLEVLPREAPWGLRRRWMGMEVSLGARATKGSKPGCKTERAARSQEDPESKAMAGSRQGSAPGCRHCSNWNIGLGAQTVL